MTSNSPRRSPGSIPRGSQIYSLVATKLACRYNGGGGSRAYLQVTSVDSCRLRKNEGVGTVVLVYVGGLLRMGDNSLTLSACRSVGDGFTGKGKSDGWVVRTDQTMWFGLQPVVILNYAYLYGSTTLPFK